MSYRYWCGECGFKTPWGAEPENRLLLQQHCERRHEGIARDAHLESAHGRSGGGRPCLLLACAGLLCAVLAALALLVAAWWHPG